MRENRRIRIRLNLYKIFKVTSESLQMISSALAEITFGLWRFERAVFTQ